ncbi:MAG: hypothetical protein QF666_11850 [Alphaproteobacteria bacterium]|mgnify:CR=1 FL=1|jgi:hypothetical protein|nr:hypothetical protein [Alphaproteobacteria bacterium]
MKLLIFNVLVAGALAYLFLGESEQSRVRSDLDWAQDTVEATIDETRGGEPEKGGGGEVIAAPQAVAPVDSMTAERPAPPAKPQAKTEIEQRPERAEETPARQSETITLQSETNAPRRTARNPVSIVTVEPLEAPPAVAEPPAGEKEIAHDETVPTGGARPQGTVAEVLPPLDDPEVARRRAVVLDIEEAAPDSATAESAAADKQVAAMAARERRDALNALAEDMELMFADKVMR